MESGPSLFARLWSGRVFYTGLLLALAVAHTALFVIDPGVQFFFGDSGSYLEAAHGYVPRDRSWVYGLLIKHLTMGVPDLSAVVAAQTFAHVGANLLFAVLLREYFGIRPGLVVATTLLASVLPLHVLWTRYIMTEAFALAAITLWVVMAFEYLRTQRWYWLVLLQIPGICAVAMRGVTIPLVVGGSVVLPLLALWTRRQQRGAEPLWRLGLRLGLHLAVALGTMLPLHHGYKVAYASHLVWSGALHEPVVPKYGYENGLFYLEFVSTLVKAEDFPPGLDGARILEEAQGEDDPRRRNHQHWVPDGLVEILRRELHHHPAVAPTLNELCTEVAKNAVQRDPFGIFGLGWATFTDFWDTDYCTGMLDHDIGLSRSTPEPVRRRLREWYAIDIGERTRMCTPLRPRTWRCSPTSWR